MISFSTVIYGQVLPRGAAITYVLTPIRLFLRRWKQKWPFARSHSILQYNVFRSARKAPLLRERKIPKWNTECRTIASCWFGNWLLTPRETIGKYEFRFFFLGWMSWIEKLLLKIGFPLFLSEKYKWGNITLKSGSCVHYNVLHLGSGDTSTDFNGNLLTWV